MATEPMTPGIPSYSLDVVESPIAKRGRRFLTALWIMGCLFLLVFGFVAFRLIRFRITMSRANHLYETAQFKEAEAEYRRAIDLYPSFDLSHLYRGESLLMLHRNPEAVAEMKRAVELEPEEAHHRIRYAQALWQCNERDGAEREFRRGLALDRNEREGHFQLACLLMSERRYDEAWPQLLESRRCAPNDKEVRDATRSFEHNHPDSVRRWNQAGKK